jgi:hypothetical protein
MNGYVTEPIVLQKYIRQGCPLAPDPFVIAAKAMHWLAIYL